MHCIKMNRSVTLALLTLMCGGASIAATEAARLECTFTKRDGTILPLVLAVDTSLGWKVTDDTFSMRTTEWNIEISRYSGNAFITYSDRSITTGICKKVSQADRQF